jgi:hypothetical protein
VAQLPGHRAPGHGRHVLGRQAAGHRTHDHTGRRPRRGPARLLLSGPPGGPAPWSAARVVVRPVPGGLSVQDVAAVAGRPVAGELGHDRGALPRGERGEPPAVGPRSLLGALARRLLGGVDRPGWAA